MYACNVKLFVKCNFKNELGPFVRNMEIRRCQKDNFVFTGGFSLANKTCHVVN